MEERAANSTVFVSEIAAALAAAEIWTTMRDRKRVMEGHDIAVQEARRDPELDAQAQRVALLMPPNVLGTMAQRAARLWQSYRDVLDDPNAAPGEVEDATRRLRGSIFRELDRIRDLNGSIPPGKLLDWWESCRAAA